MKKLNSKPQKQQQGWPKISNTARKYNWDENPENYDGEVQMYARAYSIPRLADWNHPRLSVCTRESLESVKFKTSSPSNHMFFPIQFGINLHLWVVQRAEIALTETAHAISAFWITHSCKLIPNWTRKRMFIYTNKNTIFIERIIDRAYFLWAIF